MEMTALALKGEVVRFDAEDAHLMVGAHLRVSSHGYVVIQRGSHSQYLHRAVMGNPPGRIDHRNLDKLDNRKRNLRVCTASENGRNRGPAKHNTSGFKGVYLCKQTGRYRAEIRCDGKAVKIGRFPTALEAAWAYDAEARILHGSFARLNFDDRDSGKIGRGCE